ncbi:MAG: MFS transporter, partial [Alphaproteobacteria bacterium]|nr:MFS transporter [Alphaproteobacteria bacterium]
MPGAPSRAEAAAAPRPETGSAWSPFRHGAFAVLWSAAVLSNIGSWMNEVGAGWLMTTLAPSPLMVALVQTAATLPVFLFALPAGALADIVDRRRLLLVVQCLLAGAVAVFAALVWLEWATAPILLAFTFLLGTGAAFSVPAWQAIVPKLVPKADLQPAIALNSVGINISRAIGPALGGFIIVGIGISAPFTLNALSYVVAIAALLWWRPPASPQSPLPAERFWAAIRTGLRYARSSGPLKATLLRAVGFFVFASAYWALLPLIAKTELGGGAELFGILLGCIGLGAVIGALFLPAMKTTLGPDRLVALSTALAALVMALSGLIRDPVAAGIGSILFGASWIAVVSSLNVSAQLALPEWVRARGLSIFLTVFFGSMSLGSAVWGQAASQFGISVALIAAAVGALLVIPMTWRAKLQQGAGMDLTPSMHWPEPVVSQERDQDRGPVMTMVEYDVAPEQTPDFLAALQELSEARRRGGAFAWGVFEDAARPGRFIEYFMEPSWLEHLRHHQRVTEEDRRLQERLWAFHRGPDK